MLKLGRLEIHGGEGDPGEAWIVVPSYDEDVEDEIHVLSPVDVALVAAYLLRIAEEGE